MLVEGELVYLFHVRHFTTPSFSRGILADNPVALWISDRGARRAVLGHVPGTGRTQIFGSRGRESGFTTHEHQELLNECVATPEDPPAQP